METLAQRHAREQGERKAYEKMVRVLGRTEQLPKKFKSKNIQTPYDKPEKILEKAGYTDIKRGWVRKIEGGRYHAYVSNKTIYLHKDISSNGKHRATVKDIAEEAWRIEDFRSGRDVVLVNLAEYKDKIKEVGELNRNIISQKRKNWFRRLFIN